MNTRTHCDLCGREIPGAAHPAVLLITHYTWKHSVEEREQVACELAAAA